MRRSSINVVKVPTIEVDATIKHTFQKEETSPAGTAIAAGIIAGTVFITGLAWHGAKRVVNSVRRRRASNKVDSNAVTEVAEILDDNDKD